MRLSILNVTRKHSAFLYKGCALLLVSLVLLLAVLAACPAAHEWFHHDAGHEDHECVVTLFAHGITTALTGAALGWISWGLIGRTIPPARELYLLVHRYRLQPGRAPPVS